MNSISRMTCPLLRRLPAASSALVALALLGACAGGSGVTPPPADANAATVDGPAIRTIDSAGGQWSVAWRSMSGPIRLDRPFDVEVVIRSAGGDPPPGDARITVDARMPHHRHGMLVEPTLEAKGNGRYVVRDMLLHMIGYWEFYFDVEVDGSFERAQDWLEIDG